jgi:hypothetical protein
MITPTPTLTPSQTNTATNTPTATRTITPTPTLTNTTTNTITPTPIIENLALNKTATVSTYQDTTHPGGMAVDGNLITYWQTKKITGKNPPATEWITLDLGGISNVTSIVMEWHNYYATSYTIDISTDQSNWTTIFSASTGNGGNDTITTSGYTLRYIRLVSTAWNSPAFRNWLREFAVYGFFTDPLPSATPTPSPTPGASNEIHVGDLNGSAIVNGSNWNATVSILIHDINENPVVGAAVVGNWSNGVAGTGSCTTDSTGRCNILSPRIKATITNVTFTVTNVSSPSFIYKPGSNHDPGGDSNGSTITVRQ